VRAVAAILSSADVPAAQRVHVTDAETRDSGHRMSLTSAGAAFEPAAIRERMPLHEGEDAMPADDASGSGGDAVTSAASGGLEVVTRRTITATPVDRDGMTLDEIAGFLRRAMLAGIDPDTPVRVRATRKGALMSMTVDGVATHG
jgi:hypothetical protein